MDTRRVFTTIDTHTAGGPTRIVTSGLPALPGAGVRERASYFKETLDPIRRLLLTEPRGHKDMYGAVTTEPSHPDADLGVFFMTAGGYLPSCVHSAMGVAAALLHTGALAVRPPRRELRFETPAGLVALVPRYEGGRLHSIGLTTQPGFVQEAGASLRAGGKDLLVDLVFSGVFFVLVDAGRNGLQLGRERLPELVALGQQVLAEANRTIEARHPELPALQGFALALFYQQTGPAAFKDVVIGRTGAVDRSPCGAGSGALTVLLAARGDLGKDEPIDVEGVIGTHFGARIVEEVRVGGRPGWRPEISGSAYVTGFHQFILEAGDPLSEGFSLA